MNFGAIKMAVTSKVGRQVLVGQKHSPTILFGTGVVGVVATAVMASRATLKLDEVVDETQDKLNTAKDLYRSGHQNYSTSDYKQDVVVLYSRTAVQVAKLYAPAIAVGALSIAALTGSHVILNRRNVALTAAYTTLEKGFNEYRKRVVEELGEDKERTLRYGLKTEEREIHDTEKGTVETRKEVSITGYSPYAKLFDRDTSNSWSPQPEYNLLFLRCQQNYANDRLNSRGHIFLNEVYDALGVERTKAGAVVGWVKDGDGDNFVDFGVFTDRNMEQVFDFVTGREGGMWLDFNVDGVIYDKI